MGPRASQDLQSPSLIMAPGGGHNFITSMSTFSQDNYSQSYDVVCQLACLGSKGLKGIAKV